MSPPPPPAPPTEAPPCRRAKLTVDNSNLNDQGRLLPTPLRGGMIAGGGDKLGGGALRYTHTPANETPTSLLSPLLHTYATYDLDSRRGPSYAREFFSLVCRASAPRASLSLPGLLYWWSPPCMPSHQPGACHCWSAHRTTNLARALKPVASSCLVVVGTWRSITTQKALNISRSLVEHQSNSSLSTGLSVCRCLLIVVVNWKQNEILSFITAYNQSDPMQSTATSCDAASLLCCRCRCRS